MLTDEELNKLKDAWEILVKFQRESISNMKTIDDESFGFHQMKSRVNRANNAEIYLIKFINTFAEK